MTLQRLLGWLFRDAPLERGVHADAAAVRAAGDEAMRNVTLRLEPERMESPDIDIRLDIEKAVRDRHPQVPFHDNGYGFSETEAMLLVYATSQPDELVAALVDVLGGLHDGRALAAATIAVGPADDDLRDSTVVYPPEQAGVPLPD